MFNQEEYRALMARHGIPANVAAPLGWRLLRKLGVPIAPQLFWSGPAIVLSWTVSVTALMFFVWRSADLIVDEWVEPGYRYIAYGHGWRYWAGGLIGLALGSAAACVLSRWAKKANLPSWEACIVELSRH